MNLKVGNIVRKMRKSEKKNQINFVFFALKKQRKIMIFSSLKKQIFFILFQNLNNFSEHLSKNHKIYYYYPPI